MSTLCTSQSQTARQSSWTSVANAIGILHTRGLHIADHADKLSRRGDTPDRTTVFGRSLV